MNVQKPGMKLAMLVLFIPWDPEELYSKPKPAPKPAA
jgi:hypothetical protein